MGHYICICIFIYISYLSPNYLDLLFIYLPSSQCVLEERIHQYSNTSNTSNTSIHQRKGIHQYLIELILKMDYCMAVYISIHYDF